ncbi:MAG: hypothetical protein MdMp014T_0088 [Treponematales bacterium]
MEKFGGKVQTAALAALLAMGALTMALVFAACSDAASGTKAAAPEANPPPGYVAVGTAVKLTSRTPGAVVYCTNYDPATSTGVIPDFDAAGNVVINGNTMLKAFARAEGYEDSEEITFEYSVVRNLINLGDPQASTGAGWSYDEASGVFTISGGAEVEVRGSTTRNRLVVNGTAAVTLSDANIALSSGSASPLDLADGANVTLRLAGTNTLTASGGGAGVHVTAGRTLKITSVDGDGQTSGTLTAAGGGVGGAGAGIGGSMSEAGGIITIAGGTVNAAGAPGDATYGGSAGIGGGGDWDTVGWGSGRGGGGTITITGGSVTAASNDTGSGIGGGCYGSGGTISISGGAVTVTSTGLGAGIGGGGAGSGGNITITGGTVSAVSSGGWGDPAAIGGGAFGDSGNVSITGGTGSAGGGSLFAVGPGAGGSYGVFTDKNSGHTWPTGNTYYWW